MIDRYMILKFSPPPKDQILVDPKEKEFREFVPFIAEFIEEEQESEYRLVDINQENCTFHLATNNVKTGYPRFDLTPFKPLAPYNKFAIICCVNEEKQKLSAYTGSISDDMYCSEEFRGAEKARGYDVINKLEEEYGVIALKWDELDTIEMALTI